MSCDIFIEENDGASVRKLPLREWAYGIRDSALANRWQLLTKLFSWQLWLREPFGSDKHRLTVSTVFLGIDHNFSPTGSPVLYETMIFAGKSWSDEYQRRYHTRAEAIEGHDYAVSIAKEYVS